MEADRNAREGQSVDTEERKLIRPFELFALKNTKREGGMNKTEESKRNQQMRRRTRRMRKRFLPRFPPIFSCRAQERLC
jgi:hypothetical protein